jgi:hypothetical protein
MAVQFTSPETNFDTPENETVAPATFVIGPDDQTATDGHQKRSIRVDGDPSERDLLYAVLMMKTGELNYPVFRFTYQIEEVEDPNQSWHTDLQFNRSIARFVVSTEGASLSNWLKWWSGISIALLTLGYLSLPVMAMFSIRDFVLLNALPTGSVVSTLTFSVAACSLVLLVQKLVWYGWRRCLRASLVWLSPSRFKKLWRETVRTSGAFRSMKKVPSWRRWRGVIATFIALTGHSLTLLSPLL